MPRPERAPNPGRGGKPPRPPSGRAPKRLPAVLTPDECELLVRALAGGTYGVRDKALGLLLWGTGCRVSEVVTATTDRLRRHEDETGALDVIGKGDVERTAIVPVRAMAALIDYLRPRGWPWMGSEPLLLGKRGALTRSGVWRTLKAAAVAAGLDPRRVHPHTLRHSCATHLIQADVDVRDVQEYLGHASIESTQLYTHMDERRKRASSRRHPME